MDGMNTPRFCECNSTSCQLKVVMPLQEALDLSRNNEVIIVKGCKVGPEPTDIFIRETDNYNVYKEG